MPFPQLSESERLAGLPPLRLDGTIHGPGDAVVALGMTDALRVRLLQRADGPVYLVSGTSGSAALRASDLASASLPSSPLALVIGEDHARQRGLKAADSANIALIDHDQWTVAGKYHPHRPLYRLALDDDAGTDIYISSKTGEIVLDTTRWERGWNFVGSVAHWIYPTQLRSKPELWSAVVWWLSLSALVGVIAGAVLGVVRIRVDGKRRMSPYRGMYWWHHVIGLFALIFVTTWIFSGWLSMDGGLLFSRARVSAAETAAISGQPRWDRLTDRELRDIDPQAREVEWFAIDGRLFRREVTASGDQRLVETGSAGPGTKSPDARHGAPDRTAAGDGVRRSRQGRSRGQLCDRLGDAGRPDLPHRLRRRLVRYRRRQWRAAAENRPLAPGLSVALPRAPHA